MIKRRAAAAGIGESRRKQLPSPAYRHRASRRLYPLRVLVPDPRPLARLAPPSAANRGPWNPAPHLSNRFSRAELADPLWRPIPLPGFAPRRGYLTSQGTILYYHQQWRSRTAVARGGPATQNPRKNAWGGTWILVEGGTSCFCSATAADVKSGSKEPIAMTSTEFSKVLRRWAREHSTSFVTTTHDGEQHHRLYLGDRQATIPRTTDITRGVVQHVLRQLNVDADELAFKGRRITVPRTISPENATLW